MRGGQCPRSLSHHLPSDPLSHVILPKELAKSVPRGRLLNEQEWRSMGVQQSRGWVHYAIHRPEPHILLFRRPLGTDPVTGKVVETLARDAKAKYAEEMGIGGC